MPSPSNGSLLILRAIYHYTFDKIEALKLGHAVRVRDSAIGERAGR
jgi:hypothetical protein